LTKEANEKLRELYKQGIERTIREEKMCKTITDDIESLASIGSHSAKDYQTPQSSVKDNVRNLFSAGALKSRNTKMVAV